MVLHKADILEMTPLTTATVAVIDLELAEMRREGFRRIPGL
jgi:hypothetical protein